MASQVSLIALGTVVSLGRWPNARLDMEDLEKEETQEQQEDAAPPPQAERIPQRARAISSRHRWRNPNNLVYMGSCWKSSPQVPQNHLSLKHKKMSSC